MNESKISTRYAKAFFEMAKEEKVLEIVIDDIKSIYTFTQNSEDFKLLINSPVVPISQKKEILSNVFSNRIDHRTLNLLNLIFEKKREHFILPICRNFIDLYKKEKGIKTVVFTSAHEVEEKLKHKLVDTIQEKFSAKVELSHIINSEIIGGYILKIENQQIDTSVSSHLKSINKEFLKRSTEIRN